MTKFLVYFLQVEMQQRIKFLVPGQMASARSVPLTISAYMTLFSDNIRLSKNHGFKMGGEFFYVRTTEKNLSNIPFKVYSTTTSATGSYCAGLLFLGQIGNFVRPVNPIISKSVRLAVHTFRKGQTRLNFPKIANRTDLEVISVHRQTILKKL